MRSPTCLSHLLIQTHSNPNTKSMLLCISDSNVNTSLLYPCISTMTRITNSTATYCPLPTWILYVIETNLDNAWSDVHHI